MSRTLRSFVAAPAAAGAALVAGVLLRDGGAVLGQIDGLVVLFAFAILVAELFPLDVPGHEGEATFSITFAFALLLARGLAVVIVVHVVCVLIADLVRRSPRPKLIFNAAQYALSWGAAGAVLALAHPGASGANGLEFLGSAGGPAIVAAAATFLLANTVLASTPPALAVGDSPLTHIRADLAF